MRGAWLATLAAAAVVLCSCGGSSADDPANWWRSNPSLGYALHLDRLADEREHAAAEGGPTLRLFESQNLNRDPKSCTQSGAWLDLAEDFDPKYERRTDSDGRAAFTPKTGDVYLVVVHHVEPTEGGDKYESTKYSATLTVFVPQVCPCCGE